MIHHGQVFIIMGVSGSGKSTIGRLLASALACEFVEGDDYHPKENVTKMSRGQPLDDDDRLPWLEAIHTLIKQLLKEGKSAVIACSALKKSYRDFLTQDNPNVCFIYLSGPPDLLQERLSNRPDHFMRPSMLESQLMTLEEPSTAEAIHINISNSTSTTLKQILSSIEAGK